MCLWDIAVCVMYVLCLLDKPANVLCKKAPENFSEFTKKGVDNLPWKKKQYLQVLSIQISYQC